jgi:hypothetical protein
MSRAVCLLFMLLTVAAPLEDALGSSDGNTARITFYVT